MTRPAIHNRLTGLLGIEVPILNAPMGGVATPALVAAVAEAGGMGLVPGTLRSAGARAFIRATRELTGASIGVNIPVSFSDTAMFDLVLEEGIRFVTISTGAASPQQTARLRGEGVTVFHVATSLETAQRAVEAGVDGLVVEGGEGAGLRGADEISMMVLLPLIASRIDLPLIAAGGIADGASMAAAFALGAEGVQMGTRMLASTESAVHDNFKRAILASRETDTLVMNRHNGRPIRALRTRTTEPYGLPAGGDPFRDLMPSVARLYRDGDLEAGFASVGQVGGRVSEILAAGEIVRRTLAEFDAVIARLASSRAG